MLADQAYVDLTYGEPAPTWLTVAPDLAEQSVVVETFSKRFSMTGLRLGAAIAPADVVAALTDLASTATTHPNSVAQRVGFAALSEARAAGSRSSALDTGGATCSRSRP